MQRNSMGILAMVTAAAVAVGGWTASVQAGVLFTLTTNSVTENIRGDGPYIVGNKIQVGATDELVTALGVQGINNLSSGTAAADGTFFQSTLYAYIWNSAGVQLARVPVSSLTDPVQAGGYRYSSTADQGSLPTLLAGQTYYIGAYVGATWQFFADTGNLPWVTTNSAFTVLDAGYNTVIGAPTSSGGPSVGGSVTRWAPANLQFTPTTPEPASLGLLGLGALGLLCRRPARKVA